MATPLQVMRDALHREGIEEQRAQRLLFWARAFLKHAGNAHPERLGRRDLERFLEHLAHERYAGRPTQERALQAVRTLYRSCLGTVPGWLQVLLDERRSIGGPNILSRDEVRRLLAQLHDERWLVAALVYGAGLRLIECMRLRVRDLNLVERRILIRDDDDRIQRELALPESTRPVLEARLDQLRATHIRDVGNGGGVVTLPPGVAARSRDAGRQWSWQYLFPRRDAAAERAAASERPPIHHLEPALLHRQIEQAAHAAGIHRRVTGHVLRNSYAIHMIQQGVPVRRVEQLLGVAPQDLPACTRDDVPEAIAIPAPTEHRSIRPLDSMQG